MTLQRHLHIQHPERLSVDEWVSKYVALEHIFTEERNAQSREVKVRKSG